MKNKALLLLITCTLSYCLKAQDVTIGSVEEAIELALEKNLDFRNYLINQEKAGLDYKQAKSHRLPIVNGTFNGQRNIDLATTILPAEIFGGEPGQTVETQFGQNFNYNAGITIYKELFNREDVLNKKLSKLNMDLEEVSRETFEELLKEQVSLYYYSALIAKRAIVTAEKDLETAINVQELTEQKFEEGLIDAISFNYAKINYQSVKQNLIANKQLESQSRTELKKLFGMRPDESLTLSSDFDYFLPQLYSTDQLGSNLQIRSASLQLMQAETKVKISQSSLLPTLNVNTYLGRQQFRDDLGLSFSNDAWSNYSYLAMNLSIPIFNGLNNRRNIKKSKLDQEMAINEKMKVEQFALLEDQQLIEDYKLSLEDAKSSLETYQLYEENQLLTFQRFEEGLISLDSYLNVFEDYIKAENSYLNSMSKVYAYYSQIIPRI